LIRQQAIAEFVLSLVRIRAADETWVVMVVTVVVVMYDDHYLRLRRDRHCEGCCEAEEEYESEEELFPDEELFHD
jgi:hypothetical protein